MIITKEAIDELIDNAFQLGIILGTINTQLYFECKKEVIIYKKS